MPLIRYDNIMSVWRSMRCAIYTLSTIYHYLCLLSLSVLGIYPVLVCVRIFSRLWYENHGLLLRLHWQHQVRIMAEKNEIGFD